MITKMKKLTFLVYHKEYETFLELLRRLGVVHVVEKQRGEPDAGLQASLSKRAAYRSLMDEMQRRAAGESPQTPPTVLDIERLIPAYEELQTALQTAERRVQAVERDREALEPWGDFDPQTLERLKEAGWNVSFYTCPLRDFSPEWEENYHLIRVSEQGGICHFVVIAPGSVELFAEAVRLPAKRLSLLTTEKAEAEQALTAAQEALKNFCRDHLPVLQAGETDLGGEIDFMTVKLNGQPMLEDTVVLLEGWIPADSEAEVCRTLDNESSVCYTLKSADKEDPAPIKLKNNAFTRMYEVLTKMYGMPEYAEFDPTPMIAPFFTLFFAYCMGDAGYGIVLVLLGFYLRSKLSASMRGMMNLVITLGVATMLLGAVFGTFFGASLFDVEMPAWMKQFMIGGKVEGTNYDKTMLLALIIGVVHIIVGMTVKAVVSTARFGFKDSLSAWGWLLLVGGFTITGTLSFMQLIPKEVTTWAFIIIGGVSSIAIYLLNNLRRNVLVNIGAGLWDTYNMATGLMGDTLSYIRLYALGLAGGMLGSVFNQLGFMVQESAGGVVGWFFCILILVFGHGLNIGMSCLSAFVHPLRLTFVEYFKNSGYEGRGVMYKPFSTNKQ